MAREDPEAAVTNVQEFRVIKTGYPFALLNFLFCQMCLFLNQAIPKYI